MSAGKPCTDHLGNKYKSKSEMARTYGLTPAGLESRLNSGMDLATALTAPRRKGPGKPCEDHLGNKFISQSEMLRQYKISQTIFNYRLNTMGWTLEQTLTTPAMDSDMAGAHKCHDHLGNEFPSIRAMCDHWRVPRNVFFTRRREGKSLKECLDPVTRQRHSQQRIVRDHKGQIHANLDAMCAAWNISKADYMQNIRNGLDLARALTERTTRPKKPKDHLGNEYPSINAMCRAWHITKTVLRSRLELGWTLKEILEKPNNESHVIESKDHLGNTYPSLKAMLKAWGVSYTTFNHRLGKGMTLEQALTPSSHHMFKCVDHLGNEFPCLQAMLDYWCVRMPNWHHRHKEMNMTVEQTLTHMHAGLSYPLGISIIDVYDSDWVLANMPSGRVLLSKNTFLTSMRRELLSAEINAGTLPAPMRAKYVGENWFHAWGTDRFGPSPGVLTNPDTAWLERCMNKYRPELATANKNTPGVTKSGGLAATL